MVTDMAEVPAKPLCGKTWLAKHLRKYPGGELPEQGLMLLFNGRPLAVFQTEDKRGAVREAVKILRGK